MADSSCGSTLPPSGRHWTRCARAQRQPGGADHAVWAGANDVAKGGEQLQENGFGLGLGVRGQGAHGQAGQAIQRVLLE
jgi:hypothetical protein